MEKRKENETRPSSVFKTGAVSLAFIIIGYQAALFVNRAAVLRVEANRDHPDTVYIRTSPTHGGSVSAVADVLSEPEHHDDIVENDSHEDILAESDYVAERRESGHSEAVCEVRERTRHVETFPFNPNTVSVADLQRLGFSLKQAEAIDNYRSKGGRFRRKSDFAASFVVADSVYRRLEKSIRIPLTDINTADSAAFDALPGIGPYFASRMVEYRRRLGGYSCTAQLMEIYHFDSEKYDALSDLVCCSQPAKPFRLWTLPADSLRLHPHIGNWQTAKAIVLYRENNPPEACTVDGLEAAGVISPENAAKLRRCVIEKAN